MEFEEVKYGMLMMVLCDREGRVYDVWRTFGSAHEVRAFRERKKRSVWFRGLVENCVVYGDRGYVGEYKDGCYVCVCEFRLSARFSFWHIKEWHAFLQGSHPLLLLCFLP